MDLERGCEGVERDLFEMCLKVVRPDGCGTGELRTWKGYMLLFHLHITSWLSSAGCSFLFIQSVLLTDEIAS
jgi:hypothetical protein